MSRAAAMALAIATLCACGHALAPAPVAPLRASGDRAPTAEDRKAAACHGVLATAPGRLVATASAAEEHRIVRRVEIRDAADRPVEAGLIAQLPVKAGEPFDASDGRDAIRTVWATGRYGDVAIEAAPDGDGVAITFRVTPWDSVGQVFAVDTRDDDLASLHVREGGPYEPVSLQGRARAIEGSYRDRGYLDARFEVGSARVGKGTVDVCVAAHLGPLVVISSIDFVGTTHEAELRGLITSGNGKNAPGGILDRDLLDRDALLMSARLYDLGYVAHKLAYRTERHGAELRVSFDVEENGVYRLGKIDVQGDLGAPKAAYQKLVTSKRGDVFNRTAFAADIEAIRALESDAGRKDVDVTPLTNLDAATHVIDITIELHDPHKRAPASAASPPAAAGKLQIVDLALGHGQQARPGNKVSVHYEGTLPDGTVFDSSVARGTPFVFVLGGKMVIPGFEQGVLGMRVGGKRRVTIPPELGYGDRGAPPTIPPKATLVFELELLSTGPP
ncbi:MAG TPA: FKBP-type peptidyl-prolyl cis-trans isomerase [Polyangiaceae bacterium]|nr:FKBP-type peptidyl-prolyl cis-trans isomerase [Polyangiaceae bacterium]